MNAEWWKSAEDIFLAALEVPDAERDTYVQAACGEDADLLREIQGLLSCDEDTHIARLEAAIRDIAAGVARDESWIGRTLGSYRVTQEIGEGGMGTVFLAERNDDRFEKKVAIKLVKRGMDSAVVRERLFHERRILANQEHPFIAKLLDGGETEEGIPYIVMEYVAGESITAYAARHGLSARERCGLFIKVCEAVAYAHRNLVVHRDLKPSNILVTADGTPKLLDFGIAGLAEGGEAGALAAFSLDYSAPEVVAGLRVTTAADVFSLGVLLFELIRGGRSELETFWRRPLLPGDLDDVARKAMSPEPHDRYASADQLAADIERWLGHFPVSARVSHWGYRTRRFLRRNRVAMTAAALAGIALSATTGVALWQARRAESARTVAESQRNIAKSQAEAAAAAREVADREHEIAEKQRDQARAESKLAEERLAQLAELASRTVTSIDDTLEQIPGAIVGRRKLVDQTLEFLNRARTDAGGDIALLHTIANGYTKMALVLGGARRPNLGDADGALKNMDIADRMLSDLLKAAPKDGGLRVDWLSVQHVWANMKTLSTPTPAEVDRIEAAARQGEQWHAENPDEIQYAEQVAALRETLTGFQKTPAESNRQAERAVALLDPLAAKRPADELLQQSLATALGMESSTLYDVGDPVAGMKAVSRATEIRERLVARHPDDIELQRELMLSYAKLGALSGDSGLGGANLGDTRAMMEAYSKMVAIAEKMAGSDPANRNAQYDLGMALLRTGMAEPERNQDEQSLAMLRRAVSQFEKLIHESPLPVYSLHLASAYEFIGRRLLAEGRYSDAAESAERSLAIAKPLVAEKGSTRLYYGQVLYGYQVMLLVLGHLGDRERADQVASESQETAARYREAFPAMDVFVARLWEAQGEMYEGLGDHSKACAAYSRSVETWTGLPPSAGGYDPHEAVLAREHANRCNR